MTTAHESLTLQLLEWIVERPRSYAELMDAWRTTCPRMAIWEDACADGLIAAGPGQQGIVGVTAKGRQLCDESLAASDAALEGSCSADVVAGAWVIASTPEGSATACSTPAVDA